MNSLLLLSNDMPILIIGGLVIVCAIAVVIAGIVSIALLINVGAKYKKYNKINTGKGLSANENARFLLEQQGITNVKLKNVVFGVV